MDQPQELRQLFHQLNNQLGIILAHAELMEKKAADETSRARATQVVSSVLDAMGTAKEIRMQMGNERPRRSHRTSASTFQTELHWQAPDPSFPLPVTPILSRFCICTVQNCNLQHPKCDQNSAINLTILRAYRQ